MKRVVEAITMAVPELRDDVYLFPQKRDVPAVIGKNDVGWRYVDLRHLDAPAKLRHAAILADGRVLHVGQPIALVVAETLSQA